MLIYTVTMLDYRATHHIFTIIMFVYKQRRMHISNYQYQYKLHAAHKFHQIGLDYFWYANAFKSLIFLSLN